MTAVGRVPKQSADRARGTSFEAATSPQHPAGTTLDHQRAKVKHYNARPLKRRVATQSQAIA